MTEKTGSVVKEEIKKVIEDINKLTRDRDTFIREIEEAEKKGREEVEKGLRTEGKSIREEELEWDLYYTVKGIEVKNKELVLLCEGKNKTMEKELKNNNLDKTSHILIPVKYYVM